jgi:alpha-glucosidase
VTLAGATRQDIGMATHHDEHAWWQRGVVYQIYPRSFQDSNGDGIGDLRGITSRLDHLVWLGVDAVWLSPVFRSPMEDGGYDVTDYTDIDPMFGSVADMEALVAAAHRRGLRVILDFVPNHTSHRHPWFLDARSGRESAHRDWYIWRDPSADGGPPNNWRSVSAVDRPGSAWVRDARSGQYFLATFSMAQPDLNWDNPAVRAAMHDVLRFWLGRGVDGFRIDMVGFLAKDPRFRDEPPPPPEFGDPDYIRDALYHFNRDETIAHLRGLRAVVDGYADRVLIGEMIYRAPVDMLVSYAVDACIDLPTNVSLITLPFEPAYIADHVDAYDAATSAAGAWPNYCLGNHDMPRVSRHGSRKARLALMLLLTLRGTPFVYYGDEIGMADVVIPPERREDRWSVSLDGVTRDSVRTPMQWDPGANAGFCAPDVEPWLPIADDHEWVNVAVQRDDEGSLLRFVKRLLELRRGTPALAFGGYRRIHPVPDDCVAFVREHGGQRIAVALNFGDAAASVGLRLANAPPEGTRILVHAGDCAVTMSGTLRLDANAGAVVRLT